MRRSVLFPLVFFVLLFSGGCSSSGGVTVIPATGGDPAFQTRNAFIFVDGKQRGVTPATVRIRRSFGTSQVSLRAGPEFTILRAFEIEWTVTGSRTMTEFTFGNEDRVYDLTDLSKTKDGTYVIPYFAHPVLVEDREFNFFIIVEE